MSLGRRTILLVIVAVLVIGTGVVTATGSLGSVPVIGPLVDSCGPGDTEIATVNDGEAATGETVVIQGKLDHTRRVEDTRITGFNLDGATGTIPVYLDQRPGEGLEFGDCLRVRGTVTSGESFDEVNGPVVANATVTNR